MIRAEVFSLPANELMQPPRKNMGETGNGIFQAQANLEMIPTQGTICMQPHERPS